MKYWKQITAAILIVALVVFIAPRKTLAAQAYCTPQTVQTGKMSGTQTNFPVLMATSTAFKTIANGGHVANANGYDIRPYTDATCTTAITAYQLVPGTYNASTGGFEMWVNVSSITDGTVVYMGYGDASLSTDGSSNTTWDANYKGVWHVADGSTLSMTDSTSGANNGSNNGATALVGKIDGAAATNGTNQSFSAAVDLSAVPIVTLEFWLNWTTYNDLDWLAGEFTNNFNGQNGFLIDPNSGSVPGKFEVGMSSSGSTYWTDTFTRPSAGVWHHYSIVMNRTTPIEIVYVDGVSQSLTGGTQNMSTGSNFDNSTYYIMARNNGSLWGAGNIDEIRLSKTTRSAAWVLSEYNNQSAPQSFWSIGSEVAVGTPSTPQSLQLAVMNVSFILTNGNKLIIQ